MNEILIGLLSIIASYLIGSIPTAYIMARLRKGMDIRGRDSGNVGAAAVVRQVGIWEGILVGLADIAKGAAAILIARALGLSQWWVMGAGLGALLGHIFPVYLRFRGGRGSATIIGIFLILAPVAMLADLVIIAIPVFTSRKFAVSLTIGFGLLPLLMWAFGSPIILVYYALVINAFMLLSNLSFIKVAWKKRGEMWR